MNQLYGGVAEAHGQFMAVKCANKEVSFPPLAFGGCGKVARATVKICNPLVPTP